MTTGADLLGTWEMLSFVAELEDGTTLLPYGPKAQGRIVYTHEGFMSAHLWDPERHREGAVPGADPAYFGYCGRWRLDGNRVHYDVVAATEPGWTSTDRPRTIRRDGAVLELTAENVVFGGVQGRAVIRWRKAGLGP